MKKLLMIAGFAVFAHVSANAQIGYNTDNKTQYTKPANGVSTPVKNPNQLTNYYQNNSAYNNNSTQNNKQGNAADATTAISHATYVDPTSENKNVNSSTTNTDGTLNGRNSTDGNINNSTVK